MKRILPIILWLFLFALPASAQKKQFEQEFYIGAGGGALMSSVDFVPAVLQKSHYGVYGGVSAKYISEKSLGLILELNYAQRGWTEDFAPESGFAYDRTLHYLEIPLMTHVYFGNNVRFVINAGPQLGFLLKSNAAMNEALSNDIETQKQQNPTAPIGMQYSSDSRNFDYGLIGGAGIELKTGAGNIQLEGRYYFGLGDIFENRKSKDNFFNRSAHRVIAAKLTYYFELK